MIDLLLGEFLGTMVLIYLGNGVVAGVLLNKSKAQNAGWMVITTGWAFAVLFGIFTARTFGSPDAHINPAVTLAICIQSKDFSLVLPMFTAQVFGAMAGSLLVYIHYLPHWRESNEPMAILAIHSTEPAIRHKWGNFLSEGLGTFLLILGIHTIFHSSSTPPGSYMGAIFVAILVWAIGLSLGGTTGYAINPARDLGPRIIHSLLPIKGKGSSHWEYSWIPILAPLTGASLAGILISLWS